MSCSITGKENGVEADEFPFPITRADLERGRERYNIYCTPCHDYTGNANGIDRAARLSAAAFLSHSAAARGARPDISYGVITNGFGAMYSYAERIEPADRWRIVAYIRVLQSEPERAFERCAGGRARRSLQQRNGAGRYAAAIGAPTPQ